MTPLSTLLAGTHLIEIQRMARTLRGRAVLTPWQLEQVTRRLDALPQTALRATVSAY